MAFVTADRVKDTSTTTGTGNITVSGSAPFGYRTFSTVLSVADTFYYAIQGQGSAEWEIGVGTYASTNQFARTTVLASSNSNTAVSFSSGTKNVFITLAATRTLQLGPSDGPTAGSVPYGTGSTLAYTAAGTSGQIFTSNGAGAPTWTSAGTGSVTSVAVSGGSTGLTTSGGPVTTSGTITLAGTLAATNGGTGLTSYTTGDVLYASAANTLSKLAVGTNGYTLTLAAGVPAWVQTAPWVNVKTDFGATGNGTTDDSTAIQNAINAAANKRLYFPPGTYNCGTASFSITSPIEIMGIGGPASCQLLRSSDAVSTSLFYANGVTGVVIRDLWCNYTNAATVVNANHAAVQAYNCNNVLIENVWVTGVWYVGIEINTCTKAIVNKCEVRGAYNRAIYAYQGCKDIIFSDNQVDGAIYGGSTKTTTYCIQINPAGTGTINNIVVSGNTIRNGTYHGISAAEYTYGLVISGNSISDIGSFYGILIEKANGTSGQQAVIIGNTVSVCGSYGIYLTESFYVTCVGNILYANTLSGIGGNLIQTSVITGNICINNSGDGITFAANCNRNIVTDNNCTLNTGYGLKINGATNFYTRYDDNYFYANTAGSVSDTGTGSSAGTNLTL
jgi:hypothetical protein